MKEKTSIKQVSIIGAGFSGLASAALLAQQGFQVSVFEKNEIPGGRALARKHNHFQFDYGPSWYLMPEVFQKFFSLFGKKTEDYYKLTRLDPSYRVYFDTNDYIDIPSDFSDWKKLFKSLETNGDKKIEEYIKHVEYQYQVAMDRFVYRDLRDWRLAFDPKLIDGIFRLNITGSWESLVKKYFTNPKSHKLLLYPAGFLGSDPKATPAMYALLNYIDAKQGVWYPQGGMGSVAKGIEKLAQEIDVNFHYSTEVLKIVSKNGRVEKLLTDKGEHRTDIVISASDYAMTELNLLETKDRTYESTYWEKKTLAPSGFVINLGLKSRLPKVIHHTLFLLGNWQDHFDQVFKNPQWPDNPSFYICTPSKTDNSVSPKGKDVLFILVPVAPGLKDTQTLRNRFRKQILDKVSEILELNLEEMIETELIFSVKDFAQTYNAYKGTTFGLAHTLFQTAFFRPDFRSQKLDNLFYVGQYTHPGVGVPTSIISAQIATEIIKNKYE